MKKLSIALMLVLATSAFSQDMLDAVKGKWIVDAAETKKMPEIQRVLADKKKSRITKIMLEKTDGAVYNFKKDSLDISIKGQDKQSCKFKVLENSETKLVIKPEERGQMVITMEDGHLIFRSGGPGSTRVLKKAK